VVIRGEKARVKIQQGRRETTVDISRAHKMGEWFEE
jgi:hypothetical protein